MIKVGLIHTTINSMAPTKAAFAALAGELGEEIACVNFLNEGVMNELRSVGATPRVKREILELAWSAEKAEVQGIMLNCSLMSPHAKDLSKYVNVPLISADGAMLEYVLGKASKIGVVATVPKAGPTTRDMLAEMARAKGQQIETEVIIAEGAFAALNDGDEETHNRLIQEAARSLAGRAEIIVFAQISMVRALQAGFNPGTEIVTSPEVSARTLVKLIKERGEQRG